MLAEEENRSHVVYTLVKVSSVAPSSAEKMTSLQMCQIKRITPYLLKKLFDTVNFAFMKTINFLVKIAIFS